MPDLMPEWHRCVTCGAATRGAPDEAWTRRHRSCDGPVIGASEVGRLRGENERLRKALDNVQLWAQEQHDYCWPPSLKAETADRVNELRGPCATYGAVVYDIVATHVRREREKALSFDEIGASDA